MSISDDEKTHSDANFDLKNMIGAVNHFKRQEERQQKELFDCENGVAYGISHKLSDFYVQLAGQVVIKSTIVFCFCLAQAMPCPFY